ncbi:Uncharacterized protein TCM_012392 [Theobroma cacao]|uniref:Uncharacterized protein n=1 Tax=Theobroma cacao TaxID=3641 RepID=A0A061FUZ5_THECC|nr:Uncharacterized protein TCM_012392 [Theobroma cacao]
MKEKTVGEEEKRNKNSALFLARFCCTLREEKRAFCCNFWRKKKAKNFEKNWSYLLIVCAGKVDSFVLPKLRSFDAGNLSWKSADFRAENGSKKGEKMRLLVTGFERKGREEATMVKGMTAGKKKKRKEEETKVCRGGVPNEVCDRQIRIIIYAYESIVK